ncbi:Flagellar basal body rod protein FlgB [Candidatus Zixiibacteriota bacterium]|nr:Flagellar basal body rod protein FlgB [candidate division Zixibacteria bacterium]
MSDILKKAVFEKSGIPLMQKFLDMASVRHKLISSNIANISTPGYESKDINFEGELKKAVDDRRHIQGVVTNPAHIPLGQNRDSGPEIKVNHAKEGNGINNVDADKEMANLATNQIYYSIGATLLQKKFEGLRTAIKSK